MRLICVAWLICACVNAEAAAEFQKILDHKGAIWGATWVHPYWWQFYALSHLGMARGSALAGGIAKARKAFQDFLELWRDAVPEIPVLKQARAEYAQLRKNRANGVRSRRSRRQLVRRIVREDPACGIDLLIAAVVAVATIPVAMAVPISVAVPIAIAVPIAMSITIALTVPVVFVSVVSLIVPLTLVMRHGDSDCLVDDVPRSILALNRNCVNPAVAVASAVRSQVHREISGDHPGCPRGSPFVAAHGDDLARDR
jgi:hypothetical protein